MPAELSHAMSEWVKGLIKPFLSEGAPVIQEDNALVRKIAHFLEFAALGFCIAWRRGMLRKSPIPGFFAGTAAAILDETIQLFVPNRGPGVLDVVLDSSGVLAGMLLLHLGHTLRKKRNLQS
jgi:VanZ family protein